MVGPYFDEFSKICQTLICQLLLYCSLLAVQKFAKLSFTNLLQKTNRQTKVLPNVYRLQYLHVHKPFLDRSWWHSVTIATDIVSCAMMYSAPIKIDVTCYIMCSLYIACLLLFNIAKFLILHHIVSNQGMWKLAAPKSFKGSSKHVQSIKTVLYIYL